jgi:hypothetical protein
VREDSMAAVYYPMLAMFLWTFAVMLRNVQVRLRSVSRGELTNEYFELFQGGDPSDIVVKTGNNLRNLFEFPVLFYVALVVAAIMQRTEIFFLILAWLYVGLRIGHSIVHLTFNKVPVRFAFYFASNLVLLALWVWVGNFA